MKTFETEKHSIPKGATHYFNETSEEHFAWWDDNKQMLLDPENANEWVNPNEFDDVSNPVEIPKPRTKTEFVKVDFDCASDAIKFQEGTGNFLAIKPNVIEVYEASGLHDVLKWYERGYTLYRKVETEIDERQEFIEKSEQVLSENTQTDHDIKEACGALYDAGCRFKLVEK